MHASTFPVPPLVDASVGGVFTAPYDPASELSVPDSEDIVVKGASVVLSGSKPPTDPKVDNRA